MRKQNKKNKPQRKRSVSKPAAGSSNVGEASAGRRSVLRLLRNSIIGAAVIGGAGYYSVNSIQASMNEADLSRIGNGRPAVVQVHDPQCSLCRTLQSQTRDVLADFEDDRYEYLVANIKTQKGSVLASKYGVPHVTLLLFDPNGKMVQIVRGPTSTASLKNHITVHIQKYG